MDYSGTLQFLQGLLGQNQATNASQFQQGLGFQQSQLGQQGKEFDATLALQKVIADWNNQLATKQFGLQEQGQQFNQGQEAMKSSLPYLDSLANEQLINSPGYQAMVQAKMDKINQQRQQDELIPIGGGAYHNLLTGQNTGSYQMPILKY
jgi:hypothetical protein